MGFKILDTSARVGKVGGESNSRRLFKQKKKEFWYYARHMQVPKVALSKDDGRYGLVKEKLQYQIYQ